MKRFLQQYAWCIAGLLLLGACRPQAQESGPPPDLAAGSTLERQFAEAMQQAERRADTLDALLQPVALLRSSEEQALRQFSNEEQLVVARRLGVAPPGDAAELAQLRQRGRLVPVATRTPLWEVRPLEHSQPLLTPDAHALLTEIATRFQSRISALGLPPLRLEVTSALRTAATQADLRRTNRNATTGTSTHEFGTTLDLAYSSFRAPLDSTEADPSPVAPYLQRYADALVETVAARRSRELQALLGRVLRTMQAEGKVMVTLEEQQPVYHLTVARRY